MDSIPKRRFGQTKKYLEVVSDVYGYKTYFPFSKIGNRLVSSPFFEYGGLVGVDKKGVRKLCRDLLNKSGSRFIEVHGGGELEKGIFVEHKLYQTAIKRLPHSAPELSKSISYEASKMIAQAEKNDVRCRFAKQREIGSLFYPMYAKWMRSFGSPVHPLEYFELLEKKFGVGFRLVIAEKDSTPLSFLLAIRCGSVINLVSSPAADEARKWRANDAAHWFLMRWSARNKIKWFDFGPVRYEGQRRFKAKWGVEMRPYSYWYFSPDRNFTSPSYHDPDSRFYRVLRWGWRYLLPDQLAIYLGPVIRKWLGV